MVEGTSQLLHASERAQPFYVYKTAIQSCGVANLIGGDGSVMHLPSWPKQWYYISTQDLSKAMINTENDSVRYQLCCCRMSTARTREVEGDVAIRDGRHDKWEDGFIRTPIRFLS